MRVAIIGGNFLGCAAAYYVRKSLDENRGAAGDEGSAEDEIVVYEKNDILGGNKFATRTTEDGPLFVGTAGNLDVASSPLFLGLLNDAGIKLPDKHPRQEWSLFNWDKDDYRLTSRPIKFLTRTSQSLVGCILFHTFALAITAALVYTYPRRGIVYLMRKESNDFKVFKLLLHFVLTVSLGFGLLPYPLLARVYNWIWSCSLMNLFAYFNYGPGVGLAAEVVKQFHEHLEVIDKENACTSAISVGHLLACCGLGKYAKVSAAEQCAKLQVPQEFMDDCVGPGMAFEYCDSRFGPTHISNALAALLSMTTGLQVPAYFRSGSRYFDAHGAKALCRKIASIARAKVEIQSEVIAVSKDEAAKYKLEMVTKGGKIEALGFDAVLLAATINPMDFSMTAIDDSVDQVFALSSQEPAHEALKNSSLDKRGIPRANSACAMSVIKGTLKPSFFKRTQEEYVTDKVSILESPNWTEVQRISKGCYRIVSREGALSSDALSHMFTEHSAKDTWMRQSRPYVCGPLRRIEGADVPALVLGTRLVNLACVDRVANHVEIDCMSARNAGSFFKEGVVTWK